MTEPTPLRLAAPRKQAVLYLRVSTPRQMDTAADIDPEGNSIATQRQLCLKKAESVDATVVQQFVEPGNSAQSIEKRPVFRQMLAYLKEHKGEVDFVIIYMRSRAFRNSADAALTKRALGLHGIRLLSSKEDFGQGYIAEAMEGIVDIFNELEVRRNSEDIKQKLEHKALNGGTIGRAKIGYLNTRIDVDGRLVNSIGIDEKRAPLVRQAFELYATGDYSVEELADEMTKRGLTTRPSRSRPEVSLALETLRRMLLDPYYTGVMVYKGHVIPSGRHPAIIDSDLFERVQAVHEFRSRRGQRDRVITHYLKGMLFCGRCKALGRTSRLILTEAKSRTGDYHQYFVCRGRKRGFCDLPHLPVDQVEEAVEDHYFDIQVGVEFTEAVEQDLVKYMADNQRLAQELHDTLTRQLRKLDAQEDRLIDLASEGSLSPAKLQHRINTLRLERKRVEESLANTDDQLRMGAQRLLEAVRLIAQPARLYAKVPDMTRRQLNLTFFHGFYIEDGEAITVSESELREAFANIREAALLRRNGRAEAVDCGRHVDNFSDDSGDPRDERPLLTLTRTVVGWTKTDVVGVAGIEPATARV